MTTCTVNLAVRREPLLWTVWSASEVRLRTWLPRAKRTLPSYLDASQALEALQRTAV